MQENLQENDENLEDKQLKIEIDLEEKKHQYKIQRRQLAWFVNTAIVILAVVIIAIISFGIFGDKSYTGGWSAFIGIAGGFLLFALVVFFFLVGGLDHIRDMVSLKDEIEGLEIQLRIIEKYKAALRPQTDKYKDEIFPTIRQYQLRANHNRRFYYILQIAIIFCSLLVTGLTSGLTGLITVFNQSWITPAISFTVSFLTAMVTLFRFRERSHNLQQTADAIEFEISCATRGIFAYKNLSEKETYIKLAEEVERLLNEQRKRQQQLEQASDTSKHDS